MSRALELHEAEEDCKIVVKKNGDAKISSEANWYEMFNWLIETSLKVKQVTFEFHK